MDRRVLLVVVIIVIIVIGYFAFRFIAPQTSNETQQTVDEKLSQEDIVFQLEALETSTNVESVLGTAVSIDRNKVSSVLSSTAFWAKPISGDEILLVIHDEGLAVKEGDRVAIKGEIRSVKDVENISTWEFTAKDLETIKTNPAVIFATEINVIN